MYFTKMNCDLLISSPPLQSQTEAMHLIATVYRKKSTRNFVVHATEFFSDESSCELEIENFFLLLNVMIMARRNE